MTEPVLPHDWSLWAFDTLVSTNDAVLKAAHDGAIPRRGALVVWALRQTGGRGRRGREWIGKPGNLFLSVALTPRRPAAELSTLSFVAALAVTDMLRTLKVSAAMAIKWPNDVLLDGAKLAGILLETTTDHRGETAIAVGCGVNLASHPEGDLPYPATSLAAHAINMTPAAGVSMFCRAFAARYADWERGGLNALRDELTALLYGTGGMLRVNREQGVVEGRCLGLAESGALRLDTGGGAVVEITAGDVAILD